uniref:Uncharacterized protein n=1 Tax=Eubacterium cellulosolvens (strain ATCC 43171 / JCM 9499 / 6) TaxID=633697 RepID=I5AXD5_EUBC6
MKHRRISVLLILVLLLSGCSEKGIISRAYKLDEKTEAAVKDSPTPASSKTKKSGEKKASKSTEAPTATPTPTPALTPTDTPTPTPTPEPEITDEEIEENLDKMEPVITCATFAYKNIFNGNYTINDSRSLVTVLTLYVMTNLTTPIVSQSDDGWFSLPAEYAENILYAMFWDYDGEYDELVDLPWSQGDNEVVSEDTFYTQGAAGTHGWHISDYQYSRQGENLAVVFSMCNISDGTSYPYEEANFAIELAPNDRLGPDEEHTYPYRVKSIREV